MPAIYQGKGVDASLSFASIDKMRSNSRRNILVAGLVVGIALVVFGFVLGYVVFPGAIRSRVLESVQLQRNSDAMQRYISLPQPVHLKIYIFNITNPMEVHYGMATPDLQELGPYVYDLYREKVHMEEDFSSDTLTYLTRTRYYFNKELSLGTEEDDVIVLNVPLLGIIEETSPGMQPFVSGALQEMFPEGFRFGSTFTTFMKTSVGKLIFQGVPISCSKGGILSGITKFLVCSGLKSNSPPSIRKAVDNDGYEYGDLLFSFLEYKNNTQDGPATVRRGLKNPEEVGQIVSWKGLKQTRAWGPLPPESSPCNQVKGTDSSVFPPFLDEKAVITVFQPEMCRSLTASFEKLIEFKGIPGMRYVADTDLFDSPEHKPDNWCFYPSGDENSRQEYWSKTNSGVQDLFGCLGAHMVVSFPHFYAASATYLKYVSGLKPQKKLHETYIDLETMTGSPLSAAKRLQFNMYLPRNKKVPFLKDVIPGLFPIFWAEEGMDLEDKFAKLLSESLFDVIWLLDIIYWSIIALGVLGMTAVLVYVRTRLRSYSEDSAAEKVKEATQQTAYEMTNADSILQRGEGKG